jgi:Ulp1 family protease
MCVIFPQKQEVEYCDSLGFSGKIYLNALKRWLEQEAEEKEERGFDINEWKFEDVLKNCPQQTGSINCGVFVYINAALIAENLLLSYSMSDIPLIRRKMTAYLSSKYNDLDIMIR